MVLLKKFKWSKLYSNIENLVLPPGFRLYEPEAGVD
jgi:hypothetical protein